MNETAETKTKAELLSDFRDELHKIAISDTVLETDLHQSNATVIVSILGSKDWISVKEYTDMLTTIRVFLWHQNRKILEAEE